jgi:UDP-glucose:tetrahydrobiopterin glucosyltransferase
MRIALVAPLVFPIGPPFAGGAQVVVYDLARGLTARGHDVTLFAARGSNVPGVKLVKVDVDYLALQPAVFLADNPANVGTLAAAYFLSADAFRRVFLEIAAAQPRFDVVHAHAFDYPAYTLASFSQMPAIHTLHLPAVNPSINRSLAALQHDAAAYNPAARPYLVTVSQACAATWQAAGVSIDQVIYNGVDDNIAYHLTPDRDGHLLFVGRIAPEKGAAIAIRVARALGRRLLLLGAIYDQGYYDQEVAPLLGDGVEHRGAVPREEVYDEMGRAATLLLPIAWDEPFGLVAAEALMAGTPVVAYARGALPELIEDGRTGYLVPPNDEAAFIEAAQKATTLDRAACRNAAARRFSLATMIEAHERMYGEIKDKRLKIKDKKEVIRPCTLSSLIFHLWSFISIYACSIRRARSTSFIVITLPSLWVEVESVTRE